MTDVWLVWRREDYEDPDLLHICASREIALDRVEALHGLRTESEYRDYQGRYVWISRDYLETCPPKYPQRKGK